MGSTLALGFIIGAVFGACVMGVSAWLFERRQAAADHAQVVAVARYEGARAARETVARLMPPKDRAPTAVLKPPLEDRPTRVR